VNLKVCLSCGELTEATRCPDCQTSNRARIEQTRGTPAARGYTEAWRRKSLRLIAANPYCVICGSDDDLTVDHKVPKIQGGTDRDDNLEVLCRHHNSSKAGRT